MYAQINHTHMNMIKGKQHLNLENNSNNKKIDELWTKTILLENSIIISTDWVKFEYEKYVGVIVVSEWINLVFLKSSPQQHTVAITKIYIYHSTRKLEKLIATSGEITFFFLCGDDRFVENVLTGWSQNREIYSLFAVKLYTKRICLLVFVFWN